MKNNNEMMSSLLERRSRYEAERTQKRKMLARTLTPLCCVCLVALLGIGAWHGGVFEKTEPQILTDAVIPGIKDWYGPGEDPATPADNKIILNLIDEMPVGTMNIALMAEDFVAMEASELEAYFGTALSPALPEYLQKTEETVGIYRENGGTGAVYWDQITLDYWNEDASRWVTVTAKKDSLPVFDVDFGQKPEELSVINGYSVAIALDEARAYHGVFTYKDVGFCISAKGLTEGEFAAVLSSILK